MSGVRETFQRNVDGLNDLLIKCKNEIKAGVQELEETNNFEDALRYLEGKIANAVLEIEKRKKSVIEILNTKLKLSFDSTNERIISEWENAIIDAKSQIEMFGDSLKSEINKEFTETIRIPSIEQFLIEAARKKAFTRLTFDFITNRLKVPKNKVEEAAENLIFSGKLQAKIDLPTETIIFAEGLPPTEPELAKTSFTTTSSKPSPISKAVSKKEGPEPIPISEGPQPIDLSLEPAELNLDILESPPETFEILPEPIEAEAIDISIEPTSSKLLPKTEEVTPETIKEPPSSEEEEAVNIISFFKSSVEELSEKEKEEAKSIREAKRKELEARKKKKRETVKESEEEATEKSEEGAIGKIEMEEEIVEKLKEKEESDKSSELLKPEIQLEIKPAPKPSPSVSKLEHKIIKGPKPHSISTKTISELIIPSELKEKESVPEQETPSSPDKTYKCVFCGEEVSLDDLSVILCPHACGAMGHKEEFLKEGRCAKCKAEIKALDIEFSELL